jgi:hypothetical protein
VLALTSPDAPVDPLRDVPNRRLGKSAAPQWQPDVTDAETARAQALRMGDNRGDTEIASAEAEGEDEPIRADLNPLRAAGWFFRDGDCVAIERQSEIVRTRVLAD